MSGRTPWTLQEAASALAAGSVSSAQLVEECLAAADRHDARVGVFLTRADDAARRAASASDERRQRDGTLGPLDGVPIGLKDIIADVEGGTTAQSLVLDKAWNEQIGSSTVASRLRAAGAVVMGKVTTMEFATGLPDPDKPFPIPRNPWDLERWAGGSSSGSGSGLALGFFLGAVGTDTAGSIRIPAAFDGITGLKPTFGRVPKDGVVPLGYTLDHVGPMGRTAADCALLLEVMAAHSPADSTSSPRPAEDYHSALTGSLDGLTIGVDRLEKYALAGIDPAQPELFSRAVQLLADAGAEIVEVELPRYEEAIAVDMVIMLCEALAYHARDLAARWDDYGLSTRVLLGSADVLSGADYVQAQRVRRVIRDDVQQIFRDVDLLATPTGHRGAPRLADLDPGNSLTALPSVHTPYWNPLGYPTVAIPIGLSSEGTPLSLSLSGTYWAEGLVLRAADAVQQRSDHHLAKPELPSQPKDVNA